MIPLHGYCYHLCAYVGALLAYARSELLDILVDILSAKPQNKYQILFADKFHPEAI